MAGGRLLLQLHCFEGVALRREEFDANDPAPAKSVDVDGLLLYLDTARTPTAAMPCHGHNSLAGAPELVELEAVVRAERAKPITEPAPDCLAPDKDPRGWGDTAVNDENDLIGVSSHYRIPVAAVGRHEVFPHDLHILLRHRPPSIPKAADD